jgi:peroxiredoxin
MRGSATGRWGPWLVGAAVGAAALFALFAAPSPPPPLGRGSPAPAFELPRLSAPDSIALADLGGKVVLINFWATWCKPCEDEMPAMEKLYRTLRSDGFELIAISVDDEVAAVATFRERLGLSFPILMDTGKEVASAYQTFRFPETFLVGRDGIVVERYIGPKDWAAPAYVDRIRRLLGGDPGASG